MGSPLPLSDNPSLTPRPYQLARQGWAERAAHGTDWGRWWIWCSWVSWLLGLSARWWDQRAEESRVTSHLRISDTVSLSGWQREPSVCRVGVWLGLGKLSTCFDCADVSLGAESPVLHHAGQTQVAAIKVRSAVVWPNHHSLPGAEEFLQDVGLTALQLGQFWADWSPRVYPNMKFLPFLGRQEWSV